MAHARSHVFFTDFGIPDTVMGRFDMLSLHVYLLANRLKDVATGVANELSQEVFDLYIADIERALRELGIGDTTVPKRKKKMARSFYGQIKDFDKPLEENNLEELVEKISARYLVESDKGDAAAIANYMIKTQRHLGGQNIEALIKGEVTWLAPESMV